MPEEALDGVSGPSWRGPQHGEAARAVLVLAVQAALVLATVVLGAGRGGRLPALGPETLGLGLLPLSAAAGLLLVCRRLDFSLPFVMLVAGGLARGGPGLPSDALSRALAVAGLCGGIGAVSALVTWFGRISSALWTGLVAFALWLAANLLGAGGQGGPWAWPWALALSVGVLAAGATVLGLARLVVPPSLPPIIGSGTTGLAGLAAAWLLAGAGAALAAHSDALRVGPDQLRSAYPTMLSAAALGGAYVLRGRWGAPAAVALTALGHLAWSYALSAGLGSPLVDMLVPGLAPVAALLAILAGDAALRRQSGQSAPTALVA